MNNRISILLTILFLLLTNCSNTIPAEAFQLSHENLQFRQMQTRRYETNKENFLLSSGAALLQDMGFILAESETKLGVIVGNKTRDATDSTQVALAVLVAISGGGVMPIDSEQLIRVSLTTKPVNTTQTNVRVTFQRIVINTSGKATLREPITESTLYQEFFHKLSKSIFLESQEI